MNTPLLTAENVFRLYKEAHTYTYVINEAFDEFQRISRAEPHPDLAPKFPRLAEGSTAAWIEQKVRSWIQQTPDGVVSTDTQEEWLEVFGDWILDNEIIPNASEDYPLLEKTQFNAQDALTFGFKVTSAPFYEHQNGKYAPDMRSAFWGDVCIPPGYTSIKSMPYVFLEGWWPHEQVKQMTDNPELAEGGWNMENLKLLGNEDNTKEERSETPAEKRLGLPQHYAHVVVAYQEGVKAPIFTFAPDGELLLRTKPNPDPRGKKNIQALYGKIDGTNPFGYSVIASVGAWQNLMDNDAQAYQYNRAYNLDPALIKKGTIGQGDLHPGAEFIALSGEDGIDTIDLNTNSLSEYPDLYEWQRSVLMNRLNSPTSAGDGEAPLGTTPKGISQASTLISTDDLTFIQHVHDHFGEWAETGLNIYFAEMQGTHSFTLDQKTVEQLIQLASDGKFESSLLNGNVLTIDFTSTTFPIFRFEVKGGSSKLQDETQQLQALNAVTTDINADPELESLTGPLIKAEIYNKKIILSGIHDNQNLLINIEQLTEQQQKQADVNTDSEAAQEAKPPTISFGLKDLTALPDAARVKAQYETLRRAGITSVTEQDLAVQPAQVDATGKPVATSGVDPMQSVGVKNAVNKLHAKGIPHAVIPQALEALTDNVPLSHIVSAVQPQGA